MSPEARGEREASSPEESRGGSPIARFAALAGLIAAVALVAIVMFGGADAYTVKARFQDAGQLVRGNQVQVGGRTVGHVKDLALTDSGQAEVTMQVDDGDIAPLHEGTTATIRATSLSGIANRYVSLAPGRSDAAEIDDGGSIAADRTSAPVDLDQLFNTLDPKTRKSLQDFFKNQANQFRDRGDEAKVGFQYLNPALATSSRLFNELTRDTPILERFIVDSSKLVTTLADRRDDLSGLIGNLNVTTRALGNQKAALAESIERLPPFMRRANTTFVNLRAALDDLDPLVTASRPAARALGPFLNEAREFAGDAEPAVRDLSLTIRRRGKNNDLIEFLKTVPPLADIAVESKNRSISPGGHAVSVGDTRGSFQESVEALRQGAPEIALARPYGNDFVGWLDDFSTTGGGFDATGAMGRGFISFAEVFGIENGLPVLNGGPLRQKQYKRCPGSAEEAAPDGSNVLSQAERDALQCEESARAVGPVN